MSQSQGQRGREAKFCTRRQGLCRLGLCSALYSTRQRGSAQVFSGRALSHGSCARIQQGPGRVPGPLHAGQPRPPAPEPPARPGWRHPPLTSRRRAAWGAPRGWPGRPPASWPPGPPPPASWRRGSWPPRPRPRPARAHPSQMKLDSLYIIYWGGEGTYALVLIGVAAMRRPSKLSCAAAPLRRSMLLCCKVRAQHAAPLSMQPLACSAHPGSRGHMPTC